MLHPLSERWGVTPKSVCCPLSAETQPEHPPPPNFLFLIQPPFPYPFYTFFIYYLKDYLRTGDESGLGQKERRTTRKTKFRGWGCSGWDTPRKVYIRNRIVRTGSTYLF